MILNQALINSIIIDSFSRLAYQVSYLHFILICRNNKLHLALKHIKVNHSDLVIFACL